MDIEYHLIRSDRRSIGIEVDREGKVTVRAPYARKMGVTYGRISIREQKTRWGSCSSVGNLNYNWKLVLMPPGVLDYVVVHELAHRREMNHSAAFWKVVATWMPDYKKYRKWLRDNGNQF